MAESNHILLRQSGQLNGIGEAAYLGHYHPVRGGQHEPVSASLRKFIDGEEPHLSSWITLAATSVAAELSFDLIVRVLRYDELSASGTAPMDRLCDAIAASSGKPYLPHRIQKSRETRPLEKMPGKAARASELEGVLSFNAASIKEDAKVLVVDSLLWTGATLEAVARAIHEELPRASISAFVLARADATSTNGHLKPEYFEGMAADPGGLASADGKLFSPAKHARDDHAADVGDRAPALRAVTRRFSRMSTSTALIAGLALVFLIIGALVPLRSSRKPPDMPDPLVEPFDITPPEHTDLPLPAPEVKAARAEPTYPLGVVTVPDAGLRQSASLNARMIGNATIRNGERVSIVKRYKPDVGPSWIQVRTKSGKVGWVFASVVRETKARRR